VYPAGGTVIQIGACEENTTAADTAALSATAYTGAATYTFIAAIERYGTQQTYMQLLSHMIESLRRLGKTSITPPSTTSAAVGTALPLAMGLALGPMGLLAGALMTGPACRGRLQEQRPKLCCDKPLDVHKVSLMV
jgi:hypothetical protein